MYQIILSTCPTVSCANKIAKILVERKLAACVNIIPEITSVYRWQNETVQEKEVQLIIKTTESQFNAITEQIKLLHPYETPEIIAMNIQQGDKEYLNWISTSIK